jgi:aminoglycoside 3-N-acetyltransferase
MLKTIIADLLPEPVSCAVRQFVRQRRRRHFQNLPTITEQEFRRILTEELGLGPNTVVFVHSSMDKMNIDFPFYRVLAILLETVGDGGTLLFPCTHLDGRPEESLTCGDVFDVRTSPTYMGLIPEFVRRQPGAIRSLHPTNSVVALGPLAEELTKDHPNSIYPCGAQSPYYNIVKYEGIIIGLGVSTENLSFVHCIEQIWMDLFPVQTLGDRIYSGKVVDREGRALVVETLVAHRRIRWRNIPKYVRHHVPREVCRDLKINGINFFTARAGELYAAMEQLTARGITIYSPLVLRRRAKQVRPIDLHRDSAGGRCR